MTDLISLQGKQINIQLSGKEMINGILIDAGKDIVVIFNGQRFLYIPMSHIHQFELNSNKEEYVDMPNESSAFAEMDLLTLQEVLKISKGMFTEIYVGKALSYYGYITHILNDYVGFYSPHYKLIYIPIYHIKWLVPFNENIPPYTLSKLNQTLSKNPLHLQVNPANIPLQHKLEDQLKKEEGKLVIFDGGTDPKKVGLLNKIENNSAELLLAKGEIVCLYLSHLKSVQIP
ncbi:DUF2642 domain-containing protein [Cytobacillus depressus]|uniref:DUF2642 domain-containing protein n=1 Tax=Cytobacillus depressus TaxID=1602942 RepID=A0A6L3VDQ8_9BACI|nr:DUF2642 domain-containing protein [Cytobacillus depressus]KAB2338677.1 DUF2642 domain-containing protein [Cytobacillus depressus]